MNYPEEINLIVKQELKNLIKVYSSNTGPFDKKIAIKYFEKFMQLTGNKNKFLHILNRNGYSKYLFLLEKISKKALFLKKIKKNEKNLKKLLT